MLSSRVGSASKSHRRVSGPLLHPFSHGFLSYPILRELRCCLTDVTLKQIWVLSPIPPRAVSLPWSSSSPACAYGSQERHQQLPGWEQKAQQ